MLHDAARKCVCITCFRKTGENERIECLSEVVKDRLEEHVIENIDVSDRRIPTGLCSSCKQKLRNIAVEGRKSTFDLNLIGTYLQEQKWISPRTTVCDQEKCLICKIAHSNGAKAKKILWPYRQSSGRPPLSDESKEVHRLCGKCLSPIYRGCNHDKDQCGNTKYKLENVYDALTPGERQQLAARVNREAAEAAGSNTFTLKTCGKPQNVTIGAQPPAKIIKISHADVDKIQEHAGLTNTQTEKSMSVKQIDYFLIISKTLSSGGESYALAIISDCLNFFSFFHFRLRL